ncbi:Butyrophilin-like protein 2 [Collichthys lucidus]|uniref:Butyrophilin-like protein 2 n=1 Tax=Collichthys lucidus TaxID=240159 RepID=A0A4U5VHJ5_COLLU|nr:Butyrophilin-like protein 2 [Collichthys lucidus]
MLVVFVILMHVSQHASGVEVYEGVESVLLPCQLQSLLPDPIVVWSRFDLNPTTIHQHQDESEPYVQNQHYSRRTSMSADALDTGDFSLTLNKPRLSDSGNYTCTVHDSGYEERLTDVQLQVKEPYTFPAEAWIILLVALVLLVAALSLAVYLRYKTITVSKVKVKQGTRSVKLPFKTKVQQLDNITVEWNRPEPMKVHVHQNDGVEQDDFYRDRTRMTEKPLKTGDLSLKLKYPCYRDSGTYICTVHKDGEIVAQKVVQLQVQVPLEVVEYGEWAKSLLLPFKVQDQLPEDATVEWKRSKPKIMMVHVYQGGEHQPDQQEEYFRGRTKMDDDPLKSKNLSVRIYNSGYSDRGIYVCTVHRDGVILMQKEVLYRIKGQSCQHSSEVRISSVKAKRTKLHYQIPATLLQDATVEWSRCEPKPMKVHVYQNGQDQPGEQDDFYFSRTKMKKDLLQTGDLSLTLRNTTVSDNGIYICTVHRDGHILARKVVLLEVKVQQEEVEEGVQSVQLHLQSSVQLPEDATVEWSRCEPKPMKVHVYPNDQNQPCEQDIVYRGHTMMEENPLQTGDLSLTLNNPTDRDSDFYICTVCRDGDIILQEVVQLEVKGTRWYLISILTFVSRQS